jgi:hypothetical protein
MLGISPARRDCDGGTDVVQVPEDVVVSVRLLFRLRLEDEGGAGCGNLGRQTKRGLNRGRETIGSDLKH